MEDRIEVSSSSSDRRPAARIAVRRLGRTGRHRLVGQEMTR